MKFIYVIDFWHTFLYLSGLLFSIFVVITS